jgi:hypothetical protein
VQFATFTMPPEAVRFVHPVKVPPDAVREIVFVAVLERFPRAS